MDAVDGLAARVRTLVELAPWWAEWAKPIAEAEIARFEAEHGVALPPAYRGALLAVGDHAPLPTRPEGALAPLAEARSLTTASSFVGPLASPFPHTGSDEIEIEWDDAADDWVDPLWLRGCLPLTGAGCDVSYVLVVTGPDRGRVWAATPTGSPQLHPTELAFADWYAAELDRALASERRRVDRLAALERRLADDPDDLGALIELGRASIVGDRARARKLLNRAWALAHDEPSAPGLARAVAELDLLDDRHGRMQALAELDPPWGAVLAGIAAARRSDDREAIERLESTTIPSFFRGPALGHLGLALARSGRAQDALAVLGRSAGHRANLALAAKLHAELGDRDAGRRILERLRIGQRGGYGLEKIPHAPEPIELVELPAPSLDELEALLG